LDDGVAIAEDPSTRRRADDASLRHASGPSHDLADLGERVVEDVVEDEGDPLGGRHRLQHHEQGHVHRLVEGDAVRRVDVAGPASTGGRAERRQGLGDPLADVAFATYAGGLQLVEADATRHGGQPGCGRLDRSLLVG
jgi:hypothetical protein